MADRVLFIGWQAPARGSEGRALEVFNDALGILGRKQQDGRIERFEVVLLEPNGEMGGFITAYGTAEQLTALKEDEEFRRNTVDASLSVDGMRHIDGFANEGVARQMSVYQEAIAHVPQRA